MQRRTAELSSAMAVFAAAANAALVVAAGTTVTKSGVLSSSVTLGAGSTLSIAAKTRLSIFGSVTGPAAPAKPGTLALGAQSFLFAAGPVSSGTTVQFTTSGTLEIAGQSLSGFAAAMAGFGSGDRIDITSASITATTSTPLTGGGTALALLDDGVVVATLTLAAGAGPSLLVAMPDGIDGTLILAGPAMPPTIGAPAAGTQSGASFRWHGTAGGQWSDPTQWSAALAPGAADTVSIAGPAGTMLPVAGAGAAASLTTSGDVAFAGSFVLGTLVVAGGALCLLGGATLAANAASLAGGIWQVAGAGATVTINGTASLAGGGLLYVADGGMLSAGALVLAGGTVSVDNAGTISIGAGAATGTLAIASGGTLSGIGVLRGTLTDGGVLLAQGGTLTCFGAINGSGTVSIAAGAKLFAAAGIGASTQVVFQPPGSAGSATLELFISASSMAATVTGMAFGDAFEFASGTVTQAAWSPPTAAQGGLGVLDLGAAGKVTIATAAGIDPTAVAFSVTADGLGGTTVAMVPCFVAGTRIMTKSGYRTVEAIVPSERVLTGNGAWRRVCWVGQAHHSPAALERSPQLRPVRIAAGALGQAVGRKVPERALWLSPQHAVLLRSQHGNRLVPAVALVDDTTIRRERPIGGVTYLHLQLDSHDLLITEGALTESYLTGNEERGLLFDGSGADPNKSPGTSCHTRLEYGHELAAIRRDLGLRKPGCAPAEIRLRGNLERAVLHDGMLRIEGWAIDEAAPDSPLTLDVMVEETQCGRVIANQWRPDLDQAGLGGGSCGFTATLPWRHTAMNGRLTIRAAMDQAPGQFISGVVRPAPASWSLA